MHSVFDVFKGGVAMLNKYIPRMDFESYEDFYENFTINIPENFNFSFDVVDEIAQADPEKIAMVWCNDKGDEDTFTFEQLKSYSNKTANFLTAQGIQKGDKVMLILKRRSEFWFCILALHKIGAICVPATHLLSADDIIYRNNKAGIKAVIAVDDEYVIDNIERSIPQSPTLAVKISLGEERKGWVNFHNGISSALEVFERRIGENATTNEDISLLYFTSGTTGMPKIVTHSFIYPLGHMVTAKYWHCSQENGLHLTVAETGWAKAVWGKIYGQWLCGCAVFVYDFENFKPRELLKVIAKYGVTSFCAPPTIYRCFIKENLKKYDFSKLKNCSVAGEALNPEVYYRFLEETGIKMAEGYGQTELTLAIAQYPWLEVRPGSMGKPSPGYDIELIAENGNLVDAGQPGEIVIKTHNKIPIGMFSGYYNDNEMTVKSWNKGIYYTGDIAWKDEDGYLWFVSRADDVIKSAGYKIGPYEVESILLEHPAVLECAVTGIPDVERGQVVKATIVLANSYQESQKLIQELRIHVRKATAAYKQPKIIEFVKELPKTISGKIRHIEIRENNKK